MNNIEDNPSFSGDVRLYSHSGLCNRLRLLVEYKHFSDIKNKKIKMFWVKSVQCNALFKDLFQPIPNISFRYIKNIPLIKPSKSIRPSNTAMKMGLFPHAEKIKRKNHLIFKPTDDIMDTVSSTKERITGDYIACHIRRTDIITIQKKYNVDPPSNKHFEDFMGSYPDHKIYLATDRKRTQDHFTKRFGSRLYYATVPSGDGSSRLPNRTSPVQEGVVDMFTCIDSVHFLGTEWSSFSDFIENYRKGKNAKT
jgi:hypothetical protein